MSSRVPLTFTTYSLDKEAETLPEADFRSHCVILVGMSPVDHASKPLGLGIL
jgi:hypothetical protein